jgi:hypothetical protein
MGKDSSEPYVKHVYWISKEEERDLKRKLADQGRKLKSAKGIVCTPLDPINRITSVAPEVWDAACSRQGSWYRHSEKNGLYLIISSFALEDCEEKREAIITASEFAPPRPATNEEKIILAEDPRLKEKMPAEWRHIEDMEKRIYLRWARRLGSNVEDYDYLYLSHTANHGNFIHPRFFTQDGAGIIPYSIDRSAHLCSCCLELFQVLGGRYKKKLVAPCPGATIFARLKPDRYLLVERP